MQATALVHEAYLELIDVTNVSWQHRAHFFAVSAQIMRHILLDRARRRVAAKRGGTAERVNLDELPELAGNRATELVALEDALNALAENDPRKARVDPLQGNQGVDLPEIDGREPQARTAAGTVGDSPANSMRAAEEPRSLFHAALAQTLPYQRR